MVRAAGFAAALVLSSSYARAQDATPTPTPQPQDFSYQNGMYNTVQCGTLKDGHQYKGTFVLSHETSQDTPLRLKLIVNSHEISDSSFVNIGSRVNDMIGCGATTYVVDLSGAALLERVKAGQRLTRPLYSGITLFGVSDDPCTQSPREHPVSATQRDIEAFVMYYNDDIKRSQVSKYFAGKPDLQGLEAACGAIHEKIERVHVQAERVAGKVREKSKDVKKEIGAEAEEARRKAEESQGRAAQWWGRLLRRAGAD